MAQITIGGADYALPELTIGLIRKITPLVQQLEAAKAQDGPDAEDRMLTLSLDLLSAWLSRDNPDMTPGHIERVMTYREASAMAAAISNGLAESGLLPGEAAGGAPVAVTPPLLSSSTGSSANSSRRASKAAAGTP